jgi:hypothetical protein
MGPALGLAYPARPHFGHPDDDQNPAAPHLSPPTDIQVYIVL